MLVQEGWGAGHGYPALTLAADASEVSGFLFVSEELEDHWARLDEFEGEQYERVTTTATCANGEVLEAQVYVHRRV
jgi:gamma-glutamylcyclotransferase (GGCT)/AIG2-like uncharacterized protein YtfP